jgi:hypothetical protein
MSEHGRWQRQGGASLGTKGAAAACGVDWRRRAVVPAHLGLRLNNTPGESLGCIRGGKAACPVATTSSISRTTVRRHIGERRHIRVLRSIDVLDRSVQSCYAAD